jgi:FkbM family methyltransferase
MIPTLINDRWTLLLPEHRAHRPEWPWWEATRLAAMYHFIGDGDVVYDIGAEEGDFPALFAQWGADVFLVEPNPKVWPNMKVIFDANRIGHKVRGGFVGFASDHNEEPTVEGLTIEEASWWGKSHAWPECADGPVIGDHGFRHLAQEADATPQLTIDEMVLRSHVVPTHVTMDIEGSELVALRGMQDTMTAHRPYVWVSVHKNAMLDFWCQDPDAVYELMEHYEYERVFLTYDHESHELFVPREKMWPR